MENLIKDLLELNNKKEDVCYAFNKDLITREQYVKIIAILTEAIFFKESEIEINKIDKEINEMHSEFFEMFPESIDLLTYELNECIDWLSNKNIKESLKTEKLLKIRNLLNKTVDKFNNIPFLMINCK